MPLCPRSPLPLLWLLTVACSATLDPSPTPSANETPTIAPVHIDRGPTQLTVDGDPNGLWWDAASQTLYLADDNGNRLLTWTDAQGFALAANLPETTASSPGLGQLVKTPDGTLVVTRFGGGTVGDVVFARPDGTTGIVPDLDPTRRRIGLTITDDGTLYDGWFVKVGDAPRVGAVGLLDLAGTETEVISDLGKPVGVLAVGSKLFASDQDKQEVLWWSRSDFSAPQILASTDAPDLLASGPDGSFFTGSKAGIVYQISASGAVTEFTSVSQQARGVAYDADNGRLFIADHDGDDSDGLTHFLQIVPVNP